MRRLPILFALVLPAACAQQPPPETAEALQDVLVAHQASIAAIDGRPAPAQVEATDPAPAPTLHRIAAGAPTAAGQLLGQSPEGLLRLLGEPRLRREEGSAEIWHYQAAQCHLDLILYRDEGPRDALRVAYASARAVGTTRRGEAACLRDIARGATTPAPSPAVLSVSATGA
jgi:hypothetical protein